MTKEEAKYRILGLIEKANELTPKTLENDLPPIEGFPDVPSWHDYELAIWKLGEEIRQILIEHTSLRKDDMVNEKIINLCTNTNAKRGREPFVLILGYKHNQVYADKIKILINDRYVDGHIIDTILKMQAKGYEKEIQPIATHKTTWIRKIAIKYLEKYGT